nr:hypothetical protein B3E4.30 [imported] - Neurospora crassa [Neurospora crassa]
MLAGTYISMRPSWNPGKPCGQRKTLTQIRTSPHIHERNFHLHIARRNPPDLLTTDHPIEKHPPPPSPRKRQPIQHDIPAPTLIFHRNRAQLDVHSSRQRAGGVRVGCVGIDLKTGVLAKGRQLDGGVVTGVIGGVDRGAQGDDEARTGGHRGWSPRHFGFSGLVWWLGSCCRVSAGLANEEGQWSFGWEQESFITVLGVG